MSPSPSGGPAAHRVAIISFPVTKEAQIHWSPHRGREGTGGGNQCQSHSRTPGEARPAQPRGRGTGRPLHAVAIGKSTGTTLGFSYAPRLLPSWLEEERKQMCQSSARGRRRRRRPSLVRLIAPTPSSSSSSGSSYPEPQPRGGEGKRGEAGGVRSFLLRYTAPEGARTEQRCLGSPGRRGRLGRSPPRPSRTLINWWARRTGPGAEGPLALRAGRKPPPAHNSRPGCIQRRAGAGGDSRKRTSLDEEVATKDPSDSSEAVPGFCLLRGSAPLAGRSLPRLRSQSRSRSDHRAPRPARAPPSGLPPYRRRFASAAAAGGHCGRAGGN